MATGKKLLILTEAGDGIGYGHYSRCSAIRHYFKEQSVPTEIYLKLKGLNTSSFPDVIMLDWMTKVTNINEGAEYSHVLVDSYLAPFSLFDILRPQFEKVIALDDYHRIENGPDLIINPNVFGDKIRYSGNAVGGSSFVILRNAFHREVRKNEIRKDIGNVLITLGGSDFRKMLAAIVNGVAQLNLDAKIQVIAGNQEYCNELRNLFSGESLINIYGFVGEEQMKDLMLASDLTISACGQTLHELAWLGVPTVGICFGDDQILNMKEYVAGRFLSEELYWNAPDFKDRFTLLMAALFSYESRKQRSVISKGILRSVGLQNIYTEVFR